MKRNPQKTLIMNFRAKVTHISPSILKYPGGGGRGVTLVVLLDIDSNSYCLLDVLRSTLYLLSPTSFLKKKKNVRILSYAFKPFYKQLNLLKFITCYHLFFKVIGGSMSVMSAIVSNSFKKNLKVTFSS